MAKYLAKRLVALIVILFFVTLGTFFLVHLLPGQARHHHPRSQRHAPQRALVNGQLGLNKPLCSSTYLAGQRLPGGPRAVLRHPPVGGQHHRERLSHRRRADGHLQFMAFAVAIPLALMPPGGRTRGSTLGHRRTFASAMPPFIVAPLMVLFFSSTSTSSRARPPTCRSARASGGTSTPCCCRRSCWSSARSSSTTGSSQRPDRHPAGGLHHHGPVQGVSPSGGPHRTPSAVVGVVVGVGRINIGSLIAGAFVVEYLLQLPGSATAGRRPSTRTTTSSSRASCSWWPWGWWSSTSCRLLLHRGRPEDRP